jgi:hypothetical protein
MWTGPLGIGEVWRCWYEHEEDLLYTMATRHIDDQDIFVYQQNMNDLNAGLNQATNEYENAKAAGTTTTPSWP